MNLHNIRRHTHYRLETNHSLKKSVEKALLCLVRFVPYKQDMLIRAIVIFFMLVLCRQSCLAQEAGTDTIDWAAQSEITDLLPTIQRLYINSKPSDLKNSNGLTYTEDEITLEVLSDYAWLIDFVRTRPRPFGRPGFKKGRESVAVINLETYEEHYHRIPKNINLFHPSFGCGFECLKMLFETRVESVTKADPTTGRAIRYFKTECEDSTDQIFREDKQYFSQK